MKDWQIILIAGLIGIGLFLWLKPTDLDTQQCSDNLKLEYKHAQAIEKNNINGCEGDQLCIAAIKQDTGICEQETQPEMKQFCTAYVTQNPAYCEGLPKCPILNAKEIKKTMKLCKDASIITKAIMKQDTKLCEKTKYKELCKNKINTPGSTFSIEDLKRI